MMNTLWCKYVAAAIAVIVPGVAAKGDEWPQWRGPNREGVRLTHPAFAYRHVFVRNDEELVCADLTAR